MSYHPLVYKPILSVFSFDHYMRALNILPYGLVPAPNHNTIRKLLKEDKDKYYEKLIFRDIPLLLYRGAWNGDIGTVRILDVDNKVYNNNAQMLRSMNNSQVLVPQNSSENESYQIITPNISRIRPRDKLCSIPAKRQKPNVISKNPQDNLLYNTRYCQASNNVYTINNGMEFHSFPNPPPPMPSSSVVSNLSVSSDVDMNDQISNENFSSVIPCTTDLQNANLCSQPPPAIITSKIPDIEYDIDDKIIGLKWFKDQYTDNTNDGIGNKSPETKTSKLWSIENFNFDNNDSKLVKYILKNNQQLNTDAYLTKTLGEISSVNDSKLSLIHFKYILPFLHVYNAKFHNYININAFLDACNPVLTTLVKDKNIEHLFIRYVNKMFLLLSDLKINRTGIDTLDGITYDKEEVKSLKSNKNNFEIQRDIYDNSIEKNNKTIKIIKHFCDKIVKVRLNQTFLVYYDPSGKNYTAYLLKYLTANEYQLQYENDKPIQRKIIQEYSQPNEWRYLEKL